MTARKSFKREDPTTLAFMSSSVEPKGSASEARKKASTSPTGKKTGSAPEGFKNNPEYIETKSRRVQALVQPSVYEAVKAKAKALGISTNEAINEAMRQYTEE